MKYTDQLNGKIELTSPPKRIISLVPSQTELLYDLGLRDEVVGITKFCVHPEEWFRSKTRVGGTKKYDYEKIKALAPDLIIGNKEENEKEQIEELMKHYNVWLSDIFNLNDAYDMITRVGTMVGKREESVNLKLQIESAFNKFQNNSGFPPPAPSKRGNVPTNAYVSTLLSSDSRLRTAYFIWRDPYMVAGHDTFINEMLKLCGFKNVFTEKESRYPEISNEELIKADPKLILLSSEPYPFKEKHIEEIRQILPDAKILIVDGEIFSWYGSRLLKAPDYFTDLLKRII
jgi:ABC-type Fe3+-hydroxamate transport system substrate-binding protein